MPQICYYIEELNLIISKWSDYILNEKNPKVAIDCWDFTATMCYIKQREFSLDPKL